MRLSLWSPSTEAAAHVGVRWARPRSHRSQGQEAASGQRLPSRVCPENSWFLVSVSLASVGTNHASANRGVWGEPVGAAVSVL